MWAGSCSEWTSHNVYLFVYCCICLWLIVGWCSRFPTMSMFDRRSWRPRDGTHTMKTLDQVIAMAPTPPGHGTWVPQSCTCASYTCMSKDLCLFKIFCWMNGWLLHSLSVRWKDDEWRRKWTSGDKIWIKGVVFTPTNLCIQIQLNKKTMNDAGIEPPGEDVRIEEVVLNFHQPLTSFLPLKKRLC